MKRAAICIGVDRAGTMTRLQAAAKGARDFRDWARAQGCSTKLLVDGKSSKVTVAKVFDAVKAYVDDGTLEALIVYFSGHGVLLAPGAEYWLLSDAPENPNEAVNLYRTIEDARNSKIPHVVFVSDACRSAPPGPPLSGVIGGSIFPNQSHRASATEVDVCYGTRPGNPSYELPLPKAVNVYRGIFTAKLLEAVGSPPAKLVEAMAPDRPERVISTRKLKDHLEATVPLAIAEIDASLLQAPQLRVESALPKYFAEVKRDDGAKEVGEKRPPRKPGDKIRGPVTSVFVTNERVPTRAEVEAARRQQEANRLAGMRGRDRFETQTGFTIYGAKPRAAFAMDWYVDEPFRDHANEECWHLRFWPRTSSRGLPGTAAIEFEDDLGAALAIMPGFIGAVVIDEGRVVAISYVPSRQSPRYHEYEGMADEIEQLKAEVAVTARDGEFIVDDPAEFASRARMGKGFDPTLGVFAAYAYAQAGKKDQVVSVLSYMRGEREVPIPFDVALLGARVGRAATNSTSRIVPFVPMLSQGWALLDLNGPLWDRAHERLRPNLRPALWTTFTREGIRLVRAEVEKGLLP